MMTGTFEILHVIHLVGGMAEKVQLNVKQK